MNRKREEGCAAAEILRLQREKRQRETDRGSAAMRPLAPRRGGHDRVLLRLKALAAKAEGFRFRCSLCKDLGVVLEDGIPYPDSTIHAYTGSRPCDCFVGVEVAKSWGKDRWNRSKPRRTVKSKTPEVPDWLKD